MRARRCRRSWNLPVASALRAGQRRLRGRRALRRSVSGVLGGCACFVLLVNASPAFARAVSDVPVLGGLARVVTVTEYHIDERERLIDVRLPRPGAGPGTPTWSSALTWPFRPASTRCFRRPRTGAGHPRRPMWPPAVREEDFIPVMIDVDYEIKCQNDHYLSFVLTETETRANAYTELYTYNIDLQAGRELTLRDMLGPDYKELANEAVRAGIAAQEAESPDNIYFHGEEGVEGFPSIADDQRFYINEAGNPVLIFEKYEIAPGYMASRNLRCPCPGNRMAAGAPCAELYQLPRIFYSCVPAQTGKKTLCIKLQKNRPLLERI